MIVYISFITFSHYQLRKNREFNNCNLIETSTDNSLTTSISTEKKLNNSSSISPSPSSPLSTSATTTDDADEQNMSKSELIRLVAKLRNLVEVERNALKQEQSLSAELRTKLNDTDSHDDQNYNYSNNNCSDENTVNFLLLLLLLLLKRFSQDVIDRLDLRDLDN